MANALVTSPSDLPPELLSRILEHHVQDCTEAYDQVNADDCPTGSPSQSAPYAWLTATHVCAYWRAVAVAHPLLWSHIVLTRSAECVSTLIFRSCNMPLTVRSAHSLRSSTTPLRSLRLVLAELHRVRSLDLTAKWWTFLDIAAALAHPTPALRSLSLSTPSGLFDAWPIQPVVRLKAPIEELVLAAYGFPWDNAAPFARLRRLRITNGVPAKPSVDQVLRALQEMPRLTSLILEDIFHPSSPNRHALPTPAESARLDELQHLELSGDCVACSTLLHAVEIPRDTHVALNFYSSTRPSDLALALTPLRARYPSDESRTVVIEESTKSYDLHISFGSADHLDASHAKASAQVVVKVRNDPAIIRAACEALDVSSARTLWLCGVQDCAALLGAVPGVAHLRISGHSYAQAATLLLHGLDQGSAESAVDTNEGALHAVQTLVLEDAAPGEGEDLRKLKKAIRRRRRSSGSLSNVVFARCAGVCADDFKDLGAEVEVRVCA